MTTIISNGSKWGGERPDTIAKLITVLSSHKLEERFFRKCWGNHNKKWFVLCPISKKDGVYQFLGNFEAISHVFNIETTDKKVILKLKTAIVNNIGWKEYICNCKKRTK